MGILAFQKPDKVIMHKDTEFFGQFEFRPLEKGYGVTIGNSLRRILLSSLEGYAITSVKITGVEHEFSTVKGVIEDVTEMVMNLKQIRFKRIVDGIDNEKIYINIKGQEQFLAGEIGKHTNSFRVLNPELVICNMEPFVHLEVELTVDKGRGYVPSDENKVKDANIGVIAIDSVFTPIKNVKYSVEDYRVEQKTDYEKLLIEIQTDGSIHPEEALKEAAKILIQHFMLFSDELITLDTQVKEPTQEVDENYLHVRKILKTPLSDLDLSVRAYNCLKAADIKSLAELVSFDIADLLKFRNFGKKSLSELEELVRDKGLTFGIDISKYKLDQD
ncbi:MAG: DNA-directed RNA polymerase subunit alpha [bacterium]|nr:DNA-directed RNA polymerase subunit alpha [bacterium]